MTALLVELFLGRYEVVRVLIQREVSQVHIKILNVVVIWFRVVRRAKPRQALITEVGFQWIYAFDNYIEAKIEFLPIHQIRVFDVSLNQEVMCESRAWQFIKFSYQKDSITSSTFGGLCYKCIIWVLSHVLFKFYDFIGQEKRSRCKCEVLRKEALQSAKNDAQYIFASEMLYLLKRE